MATSIGSRSEVSGERRSMAGNTATVTPPAYQRATLMMDLDSDSIREFRAATLPYGNRLQYAGRADMLAGKRIAPHTYAVRFLIAGKRAGLPRNWALRFVSWLRLTVDILWPPATVNLSDAEILEQAAENTANTKRLRYALNPTPENRRAWLDAELEEVVAAQVVISAGGVRVVDE